ncbi:hypothetical protein [Streptomyces sp. SID12488]|uniref:hypothetical protein n=1 Tax=Streptomyces sp. SID12488 TaxID=2706040 RepID=UPI0013DC47D3|nr:hypothetical protein [Streptomyces sp. SID12488]NEA68372.1 hypothetical protein [Streptomyces sp. SID12488]
MTRSPERVPTDRFGALIAAYEYEMGTCFRCCLRRVQVTRSGEITSNEGETPLYTCRECVQKLLAMSERAMERMNTRLRIIQLPRTPPGAEAN